MGRKTPNSMSEKKDLVMVAIVSLVAIGIVISGYALVRGGIRAVQMLADGF